MFRLDSFHMYGVIGTAVVIGNLSVQIIKRFKIKSIEGEDIAMTERPFQKGQVSGSLLFGMGWTPTGACPEPIFAQIGIGFIVVIITFLSALAGRGCMD